MLKYVKKILGKFEMKFLRKEIKILGRKNFRENCNEIFDKSSTKYEKKLVKFLEVQGVIKK